MVILPSNKYVGIGTTSPSYKLHVVGGIYSSEYIQIGSGRIKWDSSNNALYVEKSDGTAIGFYSKGFISAKGANDDAGGSASGVTALSQLSDVRLGTLANGQALVWNGSKWVNKTIEGGLDEEALAKYLTDNQYAKKGDISIAGLTDLHSSWDALLKAAPSVYVTRWPTAAEVGALTQTSADARYLLKSAYTAADVLAKLKTVDGSGSGLDADLLDGLHSRSLMRYSYNLAGEVTSGVTIADLMKTYDGYARLMSINEWSWASSKTIVLNSSYSIDIQRYSLLDFRHGNLNGSWQQKAVLCLPTYLDSKMIYIAQMNTGETAGSVSTNVLRYADYDTILASNVYSASKLQTSQTINGTAFNGTSNIVTSYWGTARTLSLTGNATGSVSMNGSSNVSMSVNVNYATSAGNADTLDGVHNGNVTAAILASQGKNTAITGKPAISGIQMFEAYSNGYPCSYGNVLRVKGAYAVGSGELLLGWSGTNNAVEHIYYRNNRDSITTWSEWRTLAFTTDNVASASKWQTARTLTLTGDATGSVSMDGSANVSMSVNVVDSDKLDNYHESSFFRDNISTLANETITNIPANRSGSYILTHSRWNGAAFVLHAATSNSNVGFLVPGGQYANVKLITCTDSNTSRWSDRGYIITATNIGSYNAGSATRLQTAQTIWGRPFDGTAPVSGNMTGVGSITGSGSISMSGSITAGAYVYSSGWFQNQQNGKGLYNGAVDARWYATSGGWISDKKINANAGLAVTGAATFSSTITASGKIRTSNVFSAGEYQNDAYGYYNCTRPNTSGTFNCYAFVRSGTFAFGLGYNSSNQIVLGGATGSKGISPWIYITSSGTYTDGYLSAKGQNSSSDIRLKNILCHIRPSLEAFAKAPLFRFAWKSNPGMVEIGSSAQYWRNVLPDTVKERDGWLEMGYGNIALAGVITIAREMETLEQRVDRLEKENYKLKKKVKELERRAA